MSQDDYFVVVYKVLAYLYDCLKSDKEPDENAIRSIAGVSDNYFTTIVEDMVSHDLAKGLAPYRFEGGISGVTFGNPRITMEGVQYLQENSMMKKVAKFLKDVKGSLPFL